MVVTDFGQGQMAISCLKCLQFEMTVMLFNMLSRVMSSDKPATYYQMCFKHYDRWGKNVFSLLILSVGLSYQFFSICVYMRERLERGRERE